MFGAGVFDCNLNGNLIDIHYTTPTTCEFYWRIRSTHMKEVPKEIPLPYASWWKHVLSLTSPLCAPVHSWWNKPLHILAVNLIYELHCGIWNSINTQRHLQLHAHANNRSPWQWIRSDTIAMATHPLNRLGAYKHRPLSQMNRTGLYANTAACDARGGASFIALNLSSLGYKCLRK